MMDIYSSVFEIASGATASGNKGVIVSGNGANMSVDLEFFNYDGNAGATASVTSVGGEPVIVPIRVRSVGTYSGGKVLGIN
jgi:hypothetical protein